MRTAKFLVRCAVILRLKNTNTPEKVIGASQLDKNIYPLGSILF